MREGGKEREEERRERVRGGREGREEEERGEQEGRGEKERGRERRRREREDRSRKGETEGDMLVINAQKHCNLRGNFKKCRNHLGFSKCHKQVHFISRKPSMLGSTQPFLCAFRWYNPQHLQVPREGSHGCVPGCEQAGPLLGLHFPSLEPQTRSSSGFLCHGR